MYFSTEWLIVVPVEEIATSSVFLDIFNSNPDFIEASDQPGKQSYSLDEIEQYLWQENSRENSHCLAIQLRETGEVIGTVALLVPNPDDGVPWIGLLLLRRQWQGRGLGSETVEAIEEQLAADGWPKIRLNVLSGNTGARRFWERHGYHVLREQRDAAGRAVWAMSKRL